MKIRFTWLLWLFTAVCLFASPQLLADEHKITVFKFYNKKGELLESISCYTDDKGRMVKHGLTIRYFSYGREETEYKDGVEVKTELYGNER